MQIRRVFSLVLCAALLLGLMVLPAAASETPTVIDEIEVYFYAPPLGANNNYSTYVYTNDYDGFDKEGGTYWERMFDGETDVGFYPMQAEEVFECGETYYLNMSFVPRDGYAFSPSVTVKDDCDNGRSLDVDYALTQDGTVNVTIAYTAGPGFTEYLYDCYGNFGDNVEFDAYVDGEDYVESCVWQYSTDGGTTWTADADGDGFALPKTVSITNDGWLYRCILTDEYGYTAVSNSARLAAFKPIESINVLATAPEAGMRYTDLKVLDAEGNDITGDEQAMINMYHVCIELYFGVKDSEGNWSYPDYIVSDEDYYLCVWFYIEGGDYDEYYITDDTTFSVNGVACTELDNNYSSGEARLPFSVQPSVYTLDLQDGAVNIPADDAQRVLATLGAMGEGNWPRLSMDVVHNDESSGVTPGDIALYGSVDYLLDLDFYDSYDVCIHEMDGVYTAYQLPHSSLYASFYEELYDQQKTSLGDARTRFYEVINILPDYEELMLGEITFDEPEIGSSEQPELYVALDAGFFLEYDGWELVVVEDGETAFTDFDEFEAGRTYAIACEVHADGKAITPDTEFTAVSTGGRSAEVVLDDWDPEGHLGWIVIYYTLSSAIVQQPQDAYGFSGDTASFHTEVAGDVTYRWQFSKNGGETWSNNSSAATGYNEDTLYIPVNSTRDGYLYRCKITDQVTGDVYFTEPARLIMRKPIASVDLYIAEPVIGESIYDVTMLDAQGNELSYEELDALYPFSLEYWFQSQTQSQVFTAGETLEFLVSAYMEWLEDDEGNLLYEYYFDENTVFTVNGVACTIYYDYFSPVSITVYREYEIVLPEIEEVLFSFTAPNVGDTNYGWEQLVPISWNENNGVYHLMTEESCWYLLREENEDDWFDYDFETFEAGETYYFDLLADSEIAGFTENTQYVITDDKGNVYEPFVELDPEWPQSVYIRIAYTPGTPLSITADLEDYAGPEGSTASFTVQAEGTGLTYQWWVKKPTATKFSKSSITGDTYSVALTAARNGNQVHCVVTDAFGHSEQTNTVTMTIREAVSVEELEDYVGAQGSTASFTVQATGTVLTYQWWVKSRTATKFSKSSVVSPTYSVTLTEANSGRQLYCVVTDAFGETVQTNAVSMTIGEPAAELAITADLENYVGPVGSTATFTV
ncbi:MAG: hypothetical protein IKP17_02095, partial [Oscillospiraceae bacterium]|nr:hypothetical protein [Oscillospiraceae bacterium]